MDDYLSTRAPSSSSKTVFQKKFSIYSFFQSKDGDLVCCILQTLLTTTRNLGCITWDLEKAMLLSDWSLDFRTNKAMYIYLLSNRLKTECFFANQIGSLVHQRHETTSQSLESRSPQI